MGDVRVGRPVGVTLIFHHYIETQNCNLNAFLLAFNVHCMSQKAQTLILTGSKLYRKGLKINFYQPQAESYRGVGSSSSSGSVDFCFLAMVSYGI